MGIFDNCLLACDIDGTLMSNGYINPRNIERIEYFVKEGGIFSLSTGRSVLAVSDVTSKIKDIGASVIANGCMIYDFKNHKLLSQKTIPKEEHIISDMISKLGLNVAIEIHCEEKVYTINKNYNSDLHQRYEKFSSDEVEYSFVDSLDWNKVVFIFESIEDKKTVREFLNGKETNSIFIDTCAIIEEKTQNYIEQMPCGVSKATALKELCEMFKIKKGGLFSIGDYYNDAQMLRMSDVSAVPDESPQDIKAIADYITCDCKSGAVADFIDYLVNKA